MGMPRDERGRFIKDNYYKCRYCDFSLPEKIWDEGAGEDGQGGVVDAYFTLREHVEEKHLGQICEYKDGTLGLCEDVRYENLEDRGSI